jgi:hypothetical protein
MIDRDPTWGHVLNGRFGLEVNQWASIIELAVKVSETRPDGINGYEAQLLLRELYIDTHRLCDLDTTTRPWPLISDSPRDGLRGLWPLERRLSEFELYEITKHYGYNFDQFISLPRHMVETILGNRRDAERKIRDARKKAEDEIAAQNAKQDQPQRDLPIDKMFRGHQR